VIKAIWNLLIKGRIAENKKITQKNMKIKEFIEKLEKIAGEHGPSLEVEMADGIPVVSPVYLNHLKYSIAKDTVVITDVE
jgi:hypothetical protein